MQDPEGTKITYNLIGGELPPGIKLDPVSGILKGLAPNTEDLFTFTIRATDAHGKQADNVFKMLIRGKIVSVYFNLCILKDLTRAYSL